MPSTREGAEDDGEGFFFRQLLPGRDLAVAAASPAQQHLFLSAHRMMNCIYLVGDRKSGECVVVDPCWDVEGIRLAAKQNRMRLVAAVATHAHPDHIGGYFPFPLNHFLQKCRIPGIRELAFEDGLKVYLHKDDVGCAVRQTGVGRQHIVPVHHESVIHVGRVMLKVLHTPGHCAGSVCLLMMDEFGNERGLLSGDTLLPGTVGRTDLPGSDPMRMASSLALLGALPDETVVYPGHHYNRMRHTSIGREKAQGFLHPQHEARLKQVMRPKLAVRLARPVVDFFYPLLQCVRWVPALTAVGLLVLLRGGGLALVGYTLVVRSVVAFAL